MVTCSTFPKGLSLSVACALCAVVGWGRELPPKGTDDAKRPYEMVWAGRTVDENAPALDPLTNPVGWKVETKNAVASFSRATEHLLFGDGVARLVYRATGGKPHVRIRPAVPVKIEKAFDSFSCWIYGNNHYGNRPKDEYYHCDNYPKAFKRVAFNDANHTIVFLGIYTSDKMIKELEQDLLDWGAFLKKYYGEFYSFDE